MQLISVVLIGVALAMDAFSIAVSKGLAANKIIVKDGVYIGIAFGGFQFLMPLIGWFIGSRFTALIENYSHWIGFGLLCFIGGKMIYESFHDEPNSNANPHITFRSLIILGIATSIDALAVGLTFSLDGANDIFTALFYCLIIGIVTFIISVCGYFLGSKLGEIIGSKGEVIGGIVLILIGIKMLLDKYIF